MAPEEVEEEVAPEEESLRKKSRPKPAVPGRSRRSRAGNRRRQRRSSAARTGEAPARSPSAALTVAVAPLRASVASERMAGRMQSLPTCAQLERAARDDRQRQPPLRPPKTQPSPYSWSSPPAAISSSWVPCSAILPSSRTTILPARRIVERRWAMTIAVRPWSRRSRPFSIVFSVRTSTLEVASSRIRMRGSASRARAKATSWRWPAESWTPRSPTSVSIPSGQRGDELGGADRGRRPPRSPPGSPPAARRRRSRGRCRRRGSPPGGRSRAGAAAPAAAPRAGRGRRPAPGPSAGRRSARPAWRRSTCRPRWRRPGPGSGPAARAGRRPRSAQASSAGSASSL